MQRSRQPRTSLLLPRTSLAYRLRSLDRKRHRGNKEPTRIARAEATYAKQLRGVARHVGEIIAGFEPGDIDAFPSLSELLERYAEALTPWATRTASKMLADVDARDRESWRKIGNEISSALRREIESAPTGERLRDLLSSQVQLIKSIPREAGQRVHELTLKGLEDSTRAREFAAEILRSSEVAQSRAVLIARTEVSRTASVLTQARAEHVGSEGYIWRTAGDADVRESHKMMRGKFVLWSSPPTLDKLTGHAGCLPNCRCYPDPVLTDE